MEKELLANVLVYTLTAHTANSRVFNRELRSVIYIQKYNCNARFKKK